MAGFGSALLRAVAVGSALLTLGSGCSRKIGNSCKYSTDCSAVGDRFCDTTQPGGYCTQFPCEPDTCPKGESVCVSFTEPSCPNLLTSRRFARNFCMASCSDDGDCRDGYICVDKGPYVVDTNPEGRSVCLARSASTTSVMTPNSSAAVCQPGDLVLETSPSDAGRLSDGAIVSVQDAAGEGTNLESGAEAAIVESGAEAAVVESGAEAAVVESGAEAAVVESGAEAAVVESGAEAAVLESGAEAAPVEAGTGLTTLDGAASGSNALDGSTATGQAASP